jgi:HEAT repeat protein
MSGRSAARIVLPFLLATALAGYELPREVLRHPNPGEPLGVRYAWAVKEAGARKYGTGYWIGYAVRKQMGERSSIGSFDHGGRAVKLTLEEIIAGKKLESLPTSSAESVRATAREVLEDLEKKTTPEKKVWKDVALLFRHGSGNPSSPERVEMSNLNLAFDLEGLPLIWLGGARDEESLAWIEKMYDSAPASGGLRKHLIAAAGIHGSPGLVVPFLDRILKGKDPDRLRKDAAFWMGQQDDPAGLRILDRTARNDKAAEVRKSAVFAISQVELEEAVDDLIELARTADERDVRHEAIFWLGQRASKKSAVALEKFAVSDADSRVQEQALFALSELSGNDGIEPLIKIAKTHPDPRIRKKAVFWLGESGDPRALEALIAIVKAK